MDEEYTKEITDAYITWINSISSKNTVRKYRNSAKSFCAKVFGKKPTELTEDDLRKLRYGDVINRFTVPLKEDGMKDSSIKSYLTVMKSFVRVIQKEKIFPNVDFDYLTKFVFTDKSLKINDVKHHEALSEEELYQMEEWLKSKKYQKDDGYIGARYASLVDFMFRTAIRFEATFHIKWEDFSIQNSSYGGDFAVLNVIDKGKKLNTKYLQLDYYKKLKELLYEGDDEEYIFHSISQRTAREYFKEFSEKIGRNITPHSLKAGALTTLYAQTHDIIMVKDFGDHENLDTTYRYIHMHKNPNETGAAILTSHNDFSQIDGLSKEQLLMLIHSTPEIENTIYMAGKQHKVLK